MKIGIVGATGQVGGVIARLLDDRHLPIDELRLFASARSVGKVLSLSLIHISEPTRTY